MSQNQTTQTGKACANKEVPDQSCPSSRSSLIRDFLFAFFAANYSLITSTE